MPELPEVETIKNALMEDFLNEKISSVIVNYENILANTDKETFTNSLKNQTIKEFKRYASVPNISFALLSIIRMEGKFKLSESLIDKHSHIIFYFYSKKILIYHDVRKFGRMWLFDNKIDIFKEKPLCNLGLELSQIKDANYLLNKFKKITKPIKTALLDQSIIAGIGNIYADEILFLCKINPLRKCNTITEKEAANIIKFTRKVLEKAIKMGGTTIRTYSSVDGVHGLFQQELLVHGKDNGICPECHSKIQKIRVGGRGTYYCEKCQK